MGESQLKEWLGPTSIGRRAEEGGARGGNIAFVMAVRVISMYRTRSYCPIDAYEA